MDGVKGTLSPLMCGLVLGNVRVAFDHSISASLMASPSSSKESGGSPANPESRARVQYLGRGGCPATGKCALF